MPPQIKQAKLETLEAIIKEVEKAGKVFGVEVIVSEKLDDEKFIEGFTKGKEFMKEQILTKLQAELHKIKENK